MDKKHLFERFRGRVKILQLFSGKEGKHLRANIQYSAFLVKFPAFKFFLTSKIQKEITQTFIKCFRWSSYDNRTGKDVRSSESA